MYLDKVFGVDISPTTPRNYFVFVPNRLPSLFAKRPEITRGSSVRCFFFCCFVFGIYWSAALHGGSHLYHVLRVIFVLRFVFQVSSPTMWPTSQLIGLTLLWWNWILCISGIYGHCASNGSQLVLEPIRHVVSGRSRVSYSPRELKAIRTSMPRTRLPTEVREYINSLGIRKPNRSNRAGHRRKCRNRSEADSTNRGPWNVKNSNQSDEAQQGQQDVRSPASIPSVIYANIRSVTSKIDELQAVVSINNPYIVCLTKTWLNSNIPNSACDLTDFICYRNDRQFAMGGGVCVYVRTIHPCNRLQDFESIWLKIRPHRLPRGTSSLLLAAVYHPPSSVAEQNSMLIAHLQKNIENFLASYPEGMVIITGDFNPKSTRIKSTDVTMATGLRQIVTVPTRNNSILDWCFTNKP